MTALDAVVGLLLIVAAVGGYRLGFITREPGKPRTIRLLLPREELPDLE